MRLEYTQEKYRTQGKRFHPELSRMGILGWSVVDMAHGEDDVVLVTYSRPLPQELTYTSVVFPELREESARMIQQGRRLISAVADGTVEINGQNVIKLLTVWEKER
jgi:hypothetical protein